MEIRQLQILRELGERGSVTAVAEALYVTPSAISQQLRLLQRSVAVPLTEHQGRRLALTDAGRALAASAGEVETALAKARDAVDAFINEPDGPVHLAAFHSAAEAFFPPLVRAFGKPGPPRLCLADEDVAQTEFATLTGDYDIVLAHRLDHTPPWPPGVSVTALLHEPLDVAMQENHPLASKQRVTPHDVAGEQWITVHDGFPLFGTIEAIGAAAGRRLNIVHRINEFFVAAEVVAAGERPQNEARSWLCRPERAVRLSVRAVLLELQQTAAQIQGP